MKKKLKPYWDEIIFVLLSVVLLGVLVGMGKNRSTANDTVSQATPRAVQQQPARTDLGNLKGKKILVAYFSRTGENY